MNSTATEFGVQDFSREVTYVQATRDPDRFTAEFLPFALEMAAIAGSNLHSYCGPNSAGQVNEWKMKR